MTSSIQFERAQLLFHAVPDVYEKSSLMLRTNEATSEWGTAFDDDNIAAVVIDGIVHHRRLLQFRANSYRVKNALIK